MPGFNGTGPMGEGPMTGGGRGFCAPSGRGNVQGVYSGARRGFGSGRGAGRGFGRGRSMQGYGQIPVNRFSEPEYNYGQTDTLKTQMEDFKNALQDIQKTVADLQNRTS